MMLRFVWVWVGLLAVIPATVAPGTVAFAQLADQQPVPFEQPVPAPGPAVEFQPLGEALQPPAAEAETGDVLVEIEPIAEAACVDPITDFLGYRHGESSMGWMTGDGDQFGMFSLRWNHYQAAGINTGIGAGLNFHFLNGPVRTEMPPRLFDFSIGGQSRNRLGIFGYDVAASVMASSDFEGCSREGIRFPGHAVGFLQVCPTAELVFGIDYLDRGDVKLLPVGGLILLPHPDVRFEIVFPRPRAVFRLTDEHHLYVSGELGGGTWAIERDASYDDLATYRDLRLSIGLRCADEKGHHSALEIAYLFNRRLEYTSGIGGYHLNDTAMIRFVQTY